MPPREAITGGAAHGDWSTMSNEDCTTTTRGLPWFRLYTTLTRDPRFRRQPLHYRWAWIAVLSIAARCTKRGYLIIDGENITADDLADEAAITTEQASEALDWFRSRLLIVSYRGSLRVDGWDRSQFESDSSTKRVQKHRSRAQSVEQECNVTSNVPESPPDYRLQTTDLEGQNTPPKRSKTERSLEGFDEFWKEQTRKEGKGAAKTAYSKALKTATPDAILAGWLRSKKAYAAEGRDRKHYPLPATWLNQERWDDDYSDEEAEW